MRLILEKNSQLPAFNNSVKKGPWLVWFYADWCGHCKLMKPEWDKLEERCARDPKLNVARVSDNMKDEISSDMNKDIMGFPTVRMFNNGKMMSEYSGERNNNAFLEFLLNKIKNVRNTAVKKSVKRINQNVRNSFRKKRKSQSNNKNKKPNRKSQSNNKNKKPRRKSMKKKRPRSKPATGGFIRDKSVQQFRISGN